MRTYACRNVKKKLGIQFIYGEEIDVKIRVVVKIFIFSYKVFFMRLVCILLHVYIIVFRKAFVLNGRISTDDFQKEYI